jgi:hypothetical protein
LKLIEENIGRPGKIEVPSAQEIKARIDKWD